MSLDGSLPQSSESQVGSSGHSHCKKFRFSATLASAFTGLSVVTPAKDFYLEKFGAHPLAMGVLFFIVSFLAPLSEMISGRMQNREALRFLFPINRWGRKAPWLLTSCVILSVASALMYIPPEGNSLLLHAWFVVMAFIMYAMISTMIIAFESARQEIYPYNEERAPVELYSKISSTLGICFALLPLVMLLANAAFYLRLAVSIAWLVGIASVGLQASNIWLEANSTSKTEDSASLLSMLREAWISPSTKQLCMVRWYDGWYQGVQTTNLFYYITYVLQMHGTARSVYLVVIGVGAVTGEMLSAALVTKWLEKREFSFALADFVIRGRIVNCLATIFLLVLPVLLYGYKILDDDTELLVVQVLFVGWISVSRFFQSPYTFWRVAAQCWVIDEDIHLAGPGGVRREAAIVAVVSAAQNFARALSSAVIFLGYGLAGMNQNDCMVLCKELGENFVDGVASQYVAGVDIDAKEAEKQCLDSCYEASKLGQPDSLRWYIRAIFVIGLTLIEVALIIHSRLFPIKGIRLARLYNNQTLALGGTIKGGSPEDEKKKLQRQISLSLQHIAKATPGDSKVMLHNYNVDAGIAQVDRMIGQQRRKTDKIPKVSVSCVLALPEPATESIHCHTDGARLPEAPMTNGYSTAATPDTGEKVFDSIINDEGFSVACAHSRARAVSRCRSPIIRVLALRGDTFPPSDSPREWI